MYVEGEERFCSMARVREERAYTRQQMTRMLWINQSVALRVECRLQKEKESFVCAQGRTKKEVWAERIMIDKTKDIQK